MPLWLRKFCILRLNEIIEKKNNPEKETTFTPMPKKGETIDGRFIQQYLNKNTPTEIKEKPQKPVQISMFGDKKKKPNIPLPF